jgi:alkanesulfonate monooxygenase SsuD/methylene tetrahydromethanopterin reductase-like flavin-dependent oxidoreductase (luciferase family)
MLRHCWRDERIDFDGEFYRADALAMEPKPPQRDRLPIWIGGGSAAALRRVGEHGDGWLAPAYTDPELVRAARRDIDRYAEAAGRDPRTLGHQMMLDVPPRDAGGKTFYQDLDRVAARAEFVHELPVGHDQRDGHLLGGARSIDDDRVLDRVVGGSGARWVERPAAKDFLPDQCASRAERGRSPNPIVGALPGAFDTLL